LHEITYLTCRLIILKVKVSLNIIQAKSRTKLKRLINVCTFNKETVTLIIGLMILIKRTDFINIGTLVKTLITLIIDNWLKSILKYKKNRQIIHTNLR